MLPKTVVQLLAAVCIIPFAFAVGVSEAKPVETPGQTVAKPVWTAHGPGGGYFVDFLFDERNPELVLAGGDDCLGIWKSDNGGDSWRLVSEELRNVTAWELARDPQAPDTIYSVDIYGRYPLLKSTDNGETWDQKHNGITQRRTHSVRVVPNAPAGSRVLVGTSIGWADPGEEPLPDRGGLFASTDGGEHWEKRPFEDTAVKLLETADDGKTVFAGTGKGLYRSTDGGDSWEKLAGGLPNGEVSGLRLLADNVLYAAVPGPENSLYRSMDGGDSWEGIGLEGQGIWDIIVEPDSAGTTLYCGTLGPKGVWKTTDGGASWKPMNEGITSGLLICLGQNSKKDLFASTYANEGIVRSSDGAQTWKKVNCGLHPICLSTVSFDPNDPRRILVSALGPYNFEDWAQAPSLWEGSLRSDGAIDWKLWEQLNVQTYSPAIPKGSPEKVLVGTFGAGVQFSTDGGKNFERIYGQGFSTECCWDPENPQLGMAAVLDIDKTFAVHGPKLLRTVNGGDEWETLEMPALVDQLVFEFGTERVWAASGAGVLLSEDGGATWVPKGLEGKALNALAQHPIDSRTLLAGGGQRLLFRSTDGGETWTEMKPPPTSHDARVSGIIFDGSRLIVCLDANEIHPPDYDALRGGVWLSNDAGTTWKDVSGTMFCDNVRDVVLSPDGTELYAATYSGGLFSTPLTGFE